MKKAIIAITVLASGGAQAQTATSTAIGTGIATSRSSSSALAISGQGGRGGNATVNIAGAPPVQTLNTNASGTTTQNVNTSGTTTIRNVPTVFAPGLAAAGIETCLGSISGGGGWIGTGLSFGGTIPDPSCAARLDARTLWAFGLKKAAVARLCLNPDIYRAMPEVCVQYLPVQAAPVAYVAPSPATSDYYYAPGTYRSGPIMLVDGKTGHDRLCKDYDEPRRRCRVWANIVSTSH